MEHSTQTSTKGGCTSPSMIRSPRYSEFDFDCGNVPSSPRYKYQFLPSKTHLGFQQAKVKGQASVRRQGGLLKRPQVADDKYSTRKQQQLGNDPLRLRGGVSVKESWLPESRTGSNGFLFVNGGPPEQMNQKNGVRMAGAEEVTAKRRSQSSPLLVRSHTVALGSPRKAAHVTAPSSSSASNRRHCDACDVDYVHQWVKHHGSASNKRKPEVAVPRESDKCGGSSPGSDRVPMSYMYYLPTQLLAQDDEDKSNPRDVATITTVSLPKKGRLKLTGLPCELNDPDIFDNKREVTRLKEQRKAYSEEVMGPALPNVISSELHRGTLLRNKSILRQIKQGEQLLEQEEEAQRHRKYWQEHDNELVDLIRQLLHYDMPEVPTINKNLQQFAGSPHDAVPGGHRWDEHQTKTQVLDSDDNNVIDNANNVIGNDKNVIVNDTNKNGVGNDKNVVFSNSGDDENTTAATTTTTTTTTIDDVINTASDASDASRLPNHHQLEGRRLKSRSAIERVRELDTNLQLPSSPRSLNVHGPKNSPPVGIRTAFEGPRSARSPREMMMSTTTRTTQGLHSDLLSPWVHCDSLHSVLAHAQKMTLARANLRRK